MPLPRRNPWSADRPTPPPVYGESGDLSVTPPGPFWAVITSGTGGTNRYGYTQIDDGDVPTFNAELSEDFSADSDGTEEDYPAYEINGRTDVPTDGSVRVKVWPAGDMTFVTFAYSGTGLVSESSVAWTAGLEIADCLEMRVVRAGGACGEINDAQILSLVWDAGSESWVSDGDFTHDGGDGSVEFWLEGSTPQLAIDDVTGTYLGGSGGSLLFAFGRAPLCDGTPEECANVFVVSIACAACPDDEGSFSPTQYTVAPPEDSTVIQLTVSGIETGTPITQFQLDYAAGGGIQQYTVTLTAPDGVTQYTVMLEPASGATGLTALFQGTTAPSGPIASVVQPSGTVYGQFQADDDFSAFAGIANGVWQLTVANAGSGTGTITSATICFGTAPSPGVVTVPGVAPLSGTEPLDVTATPTFDFAPYLISIDWDDGSDVEWFTPGQLPALHTFTAAGSYEVVVRGYSTGGAYAEDSAIVVVSAPVPGATCAAAALITLANPYGGTVGAGASHWYRITGLTPTSVYHIDSTGLGMLTVGMFLYEGTDCATKTGVTFTNPNGPCSEFTKGTGAELWIEIAGTGGGAYTFEVNAGTC